MMFIFVFCDMDEITLVPLGPHPIIPIWIAELAVEPNATAGLNIVTPDIAAVRFRKVLRSIV